jgi:hypothetical protein
MDKCINMGELQFWFSFLLREPAGRAAPREKICARCPTPGQLHYAREAVTRGEEGSHRCGAVVMADDAQAQRKMAPAAAWTLVELELRPWRLKMMLCSAALTSGPAGRGKGGEDSSSVAALSFGVRWCGMVLDDGDVVDGCRRELSAAVTHRGLDSTGGKKIGKGGRSNGGQHWA